MNCLKSMTNLEPNFPNEILLSINLYWNTKVIQSRRKNLAAYDKRCFFLKLIAALLRSFGVCCLSTQYFAKVLDDYISTK